MRTACDACKLFHCENDAPEQHKAARFQACSKSVPILTPNLACVQFAMVTNLMPLSLHLSQLLHCVCFFMFCSAKVPKLKKSVLPSLTQRKALLLSLCSVFETSSFVFLAHQSCVSVSLHAILTRRTHLLSDQISKNWALKINNGQLSRRWFAKQLFVTFTDFTGFASVTTVGRCGYLYEQMCIQCGKWDWCHAWCQLGTRWCQL